jgi:hypothetical protein
MVECEGFWGWTWYETTVDHAPAATVTVTLGSRTKSVADRPPCHRGWEETETVPVFGHQPLRVTHSVPWTPDGLCELELAIDAAAGSGRWAGWCFDKTGSTATCEK